MTIRPMRWWDIADVASMEARVFPDTAWSTEQFWSELAQPTRRYFVAEDSSGGTIGYAGVYLLAPDADIQTLAVEPSYRGRGVARQLLNALIETALDVGCSSMMLEVRSDNDAALRLYEAHGFEPVHRRPNYYASRIDAIIMRRRPLEKR